MATKLQTGRRSTDAFLARFDERLETFEHRQVEILTQVTQTNGDVAELKVKERIRADREEQAAMRAAAQLAARQHAEERSEHAEQTKLTRITWKVMGLVAVLGAGAASAFSLLALAFTGHL